MSEIASSDPTYTKVKKLPELYSSLEKMHCAGNTTKNNNIVYVLNKGPWALGKMGLAVRVSICVAALRRIIHTLTLPIPPFTLKE